MRVPRKRHQLGNIPGLTPLQRRVVRALITHRKMLTGRLASETSCGNVSDACIRANEKLEQHGWCIIAQQPDPLSENKFGEKSRQHEWSLHRVR